MYIKVNGQGQQKNETAYLAVPAKKVDDLVGHFLGMGLAFAVNITLTPPEEELLVFVFNEAGTELTPEFINAMKRVTGKHFVDRGA